MASLTNYGQNKQIDSQLRGQAFTPSTLAFGLILASRGYSNSIRSTAVSLNDTVIPATPNGRLYKCTTAGTTGSGEPTWSTTNGGTTSDGTAVWTEQTTAMRAGTFTEVANAGNYSRPTLNASLTNWAGTQGAGTTTASSGTSATSSNNSTITFGSGTPSANWGVVFGIFCSDSATYGSGNISWFYQLTTPKTVNNGDPQPSFPAGSLTYTVDS